MGIIGSEQSIFDLLEDSNLDSEVREALYKSLEGREIKKEDAYHLIKTDNLQVLMTVASIIRNNSKGKRITYSRKIFIPLTNICRNRCGYCG
ncbi:MAG: hypothetical protein QXM25_03955, partial [Nitrososphaerales archaeon]